jgi:MFS family permease
VKPEDQGSSVEKEPAVTPGARAYRRLIAIAGWRRYTLTTWFQRVSIAMAPVALVLAGHAAVGSFRTGALMASTYTFADGIASPLSGRLLDRVELRRGVSAELAAATVILLTLAGLAAARAPAVVLVVLSGLAGAAPAGVMGGLRAYLQRIVPDDLRERAFALDATLLELEWMTAPALVAVTGFLGAPILAIVLMALVTLGALGGARLLGQQEPSPREAHASGAWRVRRALPTYCLSAVVGYAEGTINIALAPLMLVVGARPATAGFLIALLSATSAVGGVGYALLEGRRPGDLDERSSVALLALGLGMVLTAVAPSLIVLIVAIAVCGVWFAPIVAMRNIILGKLLPESQLSEGFSTLTAAGQFGYGISGVATGIALGFIGVRACFVLAAAITVGTGLAAWSWHRFSRGSEARS